MKTAAIAGPYPWPATDGYALRLAHMIAGLAQLGEVDFFCAQQPPPLDDPPPGVNASMTDVIGVPRSKRIRRWLTTPEPRIMLGWDYDGLRQTIEQHGTGEYDLVYYSYMNNWWFFRDLFDQPAICDVELEHLKTRAVRKMRPRGGAATWAKWGAEQLPLYVDERRFDRMQQECAHDVDAVTLCSELDVSRSGMSNAVAISNGYELEWEPRLDRADNVGDPPAFSFVGLQSYGPNADASRWMATEILPLVRRHVPDATFRIVGRRGETLTDLVDLPGVVITGAIDDLHEEVDRADVAVVPIRFGSGTRLKVSEALANRIPVVTTTVGSEGIDVTDGTTALIADDTESFAAACVRALEDRDLRARLISAGADLYDQRYRWSIIRDQIAALGERVAG